jgi:hypothetical protein
VVPVAGVLGISSSGTDEDEDKPGQDDERVQVAEMGLEGSVGQKERDLTRISSLTLTPEDRACFRSISSNSERTLWDANQCCVYRRKYANA